MSLRGAPYTAYGDCRRNQLVKAHQNQVINVRKGRFMLTHLDLFSGIGGFAYAADQVFGDVEHIFCDNDKFCRQVLKKHWPESEIYSDIKQITTNPFGGRLQGGEQEKTEGQSQLADRERCDQTPFLLTGGFPCQPFSQAGARRGTADDRYLWPEMLRVIRLAQPEWVIAENVGGLVTWNEGLVLETVCLDLEAAGYEVQPFIIPAVAVNAPHRRDRVWFIAHAKSDGYYGKVGLERQPDTQAAEYSDEDKASPDTRCIRRKQGRSQGLQPARQEPEQPYGVQFGERYGWESDWMEIAAKFCRVDDGLPKGLDRSQQLKAYGNAIVPQVAMEIMKAIGLAAPGRKKQT